MSSRPKVKYPARGYQVVTKCLSIFGECCSSVSQYWLCVICLMVMLCSETVFFNLWSNVAFLLWCLPLDVTREHHAIVHQWPSFMKQTVQIYVMTRCRFHLMPLLAVVASLSTGDIYRNRFFSFTHTTLDPQMVYCRRMANYLTLILKFT